MAGRSAASQVEKQPDLPLGENKPVDNSVEVEKSEEPDIEVSVEGDDQTPPAETPTSEPSKQEEPVSALQKQLEQLRESEAIAKANHDRMVRERDEAIEQRQKYERESVRDRQSAQQSQLDAINNAMVAAKAEAEAARRELTAAITNADPEAQAEAHYKMSQAVASYGRLEEGKESLEYQIKLVQNQRQKEQEEASKAPPPPQQPLDPIDAMQVPDRAKEWLREHRDYVTDARKNAKLTNAHWEAIDAGNKEFSTAYFIEVERLLGLSAPPQQDSEGERAPQKAPPETQRTTIVSAPVSREATSGGSSTSSTKIRLTREQSEMAKLAGITETEYAKQLIKLNEYKKNGSYGESR